MEPSTKALEQAEKELGVFFSLMICYVLQPDARNMDAFMQHACRMSPPQEKRAQEMLDRFTGDRPLLWFTLLRAISQKKFCAQTLRKQGLLGTERMKRKQLSARLTRRIMRLSPYPNAKWTVIERSDKGHVRRTVYYGRNILPSPPHMEKRQRMYLVTSGKSDLVEFKHVTELA